MPAASLLESDWLPVLRSGSSNSWMKPHEVTVDLHGNPVIDLAWPRADFRIACFELLIGLLATACPPEDDEAWMEWWRNPPSPEVLRAAFAPFAAAFMLDGDGARFCQDAEDFSGESIPIERLLIDAPGENTVKRNTDLLVKRNRVPVLSRAAAAMALYTLQSFAPSGGAGHRTSLRGGGPLTTLIVPIPPPENAHPRTLWHLLWANVPCGKTPGAGEFPLVFPWLAPTRRSEADIGTNLESSQAHRLQAFWGMPRRIRLDCRAALPGEVCGLTGRADAAVVTGFRTRPWGVQYTYAARFHPLTPTYTTRPGAQPLAVHPQPDGIGYRHWCGLVGASEKSNPAAAIINFMKREPSQEGAPWQEARLLVAGYDMDNMKARAFVEAEMPFFIIAKEDLRHAFLVFSREMADGATEAAGMLRLQLRIALNVSESDRSVVDSVRQRFFEDTAADFWMTLRGAVRRDVPMGDDERLLLALAWLRTLRRHALELFDEAAPLDPLSPGAAGKMKDGRWAPPPVVAARRNLGVGLAGYGKFGEALFRALQLELPEKSSTPRKEKARLNG